MRKTFAVSIVCFAILLWCVDGAIKTLCDSSTTAVNIETVEEVKSYTIFKKTADFDCFVTVNPANKRKIVLITGGSPTANSKVKLKEFETGEGEFDVNKKDKLKGAYLSKISAALVKQSEKTGEAGYEPVIFALHFGCDGTVKLDDKIPLKLYHPIVTDGSRNLIQSPENCKITIKQSDGKRVALLTGNLKYLVKSCTSSFHILVTKLDDDYNNKEICFPISWALTGKEVAVTFVSLNKVKSNAEIYVEAVAYNEKISVGQKKITLSNKMQSFATNKDGIQETYSVSLSSLYTFEKTLNQGLLIMNKFQGVTDAATVNFRNLGDDVNVEKDFGKAIRLLVEKNIDASITATYKTAKKIVDIDFTVFLLCEQEITINESFEFDIFYVPNKEKSFVLGQYKPIEKCTVTIKTDDGSNMNVLMRELDMREKSTPCGENKDKITMTNLDGKNEARSFCKIEQWGGINKKIFLKSPSKITLDLKTTGNENKFNFVIKKILATTTISVTTKSQNKTSTTKNNTVDTKCATFSFFAIILILKLLI